MRPSRAGAKINQSAAFQNAAQAVTVSATSNVQIVDLAGIGSFGVSVTNIGESAVKDKSTLIDPTTYVNPFGTAGGKALGGSILATSITDDTKAIVAPGVLTHIGAMGSLAVAATEMVDADRDRVRRRAPPGRAVRWPSPAAAWATARRSDTVTREIESGHGGWLPTSRGNGRRVRRRQHRRLPDRHRRVRW